MSCSFPAKIGYLLEICILILGCLITIKKNHSGRHAYFDNCDKHKHNNILKICMLILPFSVHYKCN